MSVASASDLEALGRAVLAASEGAVQSAEVACGELTLKAPAARILEALRGLRDHPDFRFIQLIDLCGADYPDRPLRFEVIYHLLSPSKNRRVRLKVSTDEDTPVPSAVAVHPCAEWFEREAFDLFGILFDGHPDLRRILTDYGFHGHPLRKDFPMTGYVEVRWDEALKRVIYEPVKLAAEYRSFDFLSPWEGARQAAAGGQALLAGDEKAQAAPAAPPPGGS